MRKCQYFGHVARAAKLQKKTVDGRKSRRNKEEGKSEGIVDRRGVRTDGDRNEEEGKTEGIMERGRGEDGGNHGSER